MADSTHSTLRRGLAATIAGLAIAVSVGVVIGGQHASAQVAIPNKTCTGGGPGGVAEPGDAITCTVQAAGSLFDGATVTVKPTAPSGATIPSGGCTGFNGSSNNPPYTTTIFSGQNGGTSGVCTFVLHVTSPLPVANVPVLGNITMGTETLVIPTTTPAGTSVTQQAFECGGIPVPAQPALPCGPYTPMGTSGAGSCVGGTALPAPIGGCQPSLPSSSPTASATATPSGSGNGGSTNTGGSTDTSTPTPGAVKAAATSTPFTGGPDHPLPVVAALVAAGGALLALLAAAGPSIVRRRHLP